MYRLLLVAAAGVSAAAALNATSSYVCDLSHFIAMPASDFPTSGLSAPQLLAAAALYSSGAALRHTSYAYASAIDGKAMSLTTDCSCYLNWLTINYLPTAYAAVPPDPTVTPAVPRAKSWTDYFKSLGSDAEGAAAGAGAAAWALISDVRQLQAGDVIAYELPPGSTDTGHVMIGINTTDVPVVQPCDNPAPGSYHAAFWAYVADASTVLHQNDTRGPGKPFANGVGRGNFRLLTDSSYYPVAFQFADGDGIHADTIAIGRPLTV